MKTSEKNIYKIFIIALILIMQLFSYGCGGGGGGHKDSDNLYTISGKVEIIDDVSRQAQSENREKITVMIEQQPAIFTTCDENGNFTLSVPKFSDSVNLIAYKGNIKSIDFRLQRSDDISLSKEKIINAGKLKLTPGKNTFSIRLTDDYFNPIRYAQCAFCGFEISSDLDGIISFPKFPENITKVKATIKASGMKEFTNEFPVFTEDLGPVVAISAYTINENKNPIIITFEKFEFEPNPGELVDLVAKIDDKSNIFSNSNKNVSWYCTDGEILELKENTSLWRAPSYPCLASITAYVSMENYRSAVTVGVAVGKSREPSSRFSSFYPEKAAAGQTLSLIGTGFGKEKGQVFFTGAKEVEILSWQSTLIDVRVPDDAETGIITIKTSDKKTLTSPEDFICIDYTTKLSCNYGVPGTEITITGYGFGDTKENNSDLLYDNEKIDNIVSWTNRSIKFKVEELSGAAPHTANLDLVIRGRKRSLGNFSVSYIKSLSPEEAQHYTYESEVERSVITLTGDGFGDQDNNPLKSSSVKFLTYGENNKVEYIASEIKSWTDDEIEVYLPPKAQTGNVILNINGYEIQGPKVTIIPASGYSEQISARFSDSLMVSNPLITGVIIDSDRVYLCDVMNYRLWYLDNNQYNYISITDAINSYKPYVGAINNAGEIILADWENKTLVKVVDGAVSQKSKYVFTGAPMGLCISKSTGYIYASDSGANKIIVFDENLNKIDSFGSEGVGNGKFTEPYGICLNPSETSIFVADSGNHRIQQFDISSDSEGKKEYIFRCWYGSFNGNNGKHTQVDEFGESDGEHPLGFVSPSSVACDGSYFYVTDISRNIIQKINLTNLSCEVFGEIGNKESQFMAPTDIKLLESNVYIADSENSRMQVISKTGIYESQQSPKIEGAHVNFLGISMNSDYDSIYIVDSYDCSISKFDIYGTFEKKIGSKGSGVGQLLNPSDVMLDKDDNIWVADTDNRRLVMFPSDGSEAKSFGKGGSGNGQFKSPQRLACNSQGDIYVSDCDKNVVMRFNKSGEYLYSIGQSDLNQPFGIAIDSSDNLYVCDAANHRVCKYDANNQFQGWFGLAYGQEAGGWHDASEDTNGTSGSTPCQFTTPMYLDIDSEDTLYILDYGSRKIQKLDTKNTGILGGHICSVEINTDMYGIAVDDKGCFFLTTDDFVRKYVPAP